MRPDDLLSVLNHEIPLTRAMALQVERCEPTVVSLLAPIDPNRNHKQTAFGGSLYSVAVLSCWSLVYVALLEESLHGQIVIQDGNMSYLKPVPEDFVATCNRCDAETYDRFLRMLKRKGVGRLSLISEIKNQSALAAKFEGDFVVHLLG